ncbi:MAG TPA: hypothetical protein HA218_01255 [Nanoarchaeota archaeon]|nr:hypothetical protein [Nanoarchaeota archaeon]
MQETKTQRKNKSKKIKINKMANYKCFKCGKKIAHKALQKTKGKCTYCDSRIFYKVRSTVTRIKAD